MTETAERTRLRRFGLAAGTAFVLASLFFSWQEVHRAAAALAALGGYLLVGAVARPGLLRSAEWAWTGLGHALGWLNTRLVLSLTFFLMVAPLGVLLRLLGRDGLAWRLNPARATYFEPKRVRIAPPESFDRLY